MRPVAICVRCFFAARIGRKVGAGKDPAHELGVRAAKSRVYHKNNHSRAALRKMKLPV